MIYIQDNFIEENLFKRTQEHLNNNDFIEHIVGEKLFYVQSPIKEFDNYVFTELEKIERQPLKKILSFFRLSTDKLDDEWRIHIDYLTNDGVLHETPRAAVIYISPSQFETLHGTALWEHHIHGQSFTPSIDDQNSLKEYDRIICEDRNDLSKFTLKSVIGWNPNRLISFPSNLFHSKYPNKSWESGRQLYITFYKYRN